MQPVGHPRRDPAPSRMAYRLNRLWLTPVFRALLRVGLPVFLLVFVLAWQLGDAGRRSAIVESYETVRDSIAMRPEFQVSGLSISAGSPETAAAIGAVLALEFPVSSFDLDLHGLRQGIEALDWVERAELRVNAGVLDVIVTERQPVVVWRNQDRLDLLGKDGKRVGTIASRTLRTDLPLIAGVGAEMAVPEALAIFAAAEPLNDRLRGLVRLGERRWDLVLDRDQRILLPEQEPIRALERVIALDQAQDLLGRDVRIIDMRNGQRPTLRLGPDAVAGRTGMGAQSKGAGNI